MSGDSSEDETMDALDIKPPQHVHRHHNKDRKRERSHKHPKSHRNSKNELLEGSSSRRQSSQQHHHQRSGGDLRDRRGGGDGGHHSRQQRYPAVELIPQQEVRHRSSSRKYNIHSSGEGMPSSSSSRNLSSSKSGERSSRFVGEDESRGVEERHVVKLAKDKRSKDLREAMEKRKRLEMENEKALREIERRREQERISEDSGGSGGGGGGRSSNNKYKRGQEELIEHQSRSSKYAEEEGRGSRRYPEESPSPDNSKQDRLETDELQGHVNLEIEDIEESSSELEEGEERTPHPEAGVGNVDPHNQNSARSNVSSASPTERHQEERLEDEPSKATSDVSSTTSSSRKSDGRSDVSSSSSSSGDDTDSEKEDNNESRKKKLNGDDESRPAKVARVDSPATPGSLKDVGSPLCSEQNESRGLDSSNIPTVIVTAEDEDVKDLLPPYLPAVQGCRRVEEFSLLNRIEEGTYGVVYRAKDKRTDEIVALKRLKMEKEKDGFPITSLREINTLLKAQHENIVTVREIVVGSNTDKIFLVMDYVEHDLKALMETLKQKGQVFLPEEVKCLMIQLLRAVAHMHDNWILHRDLKTSNLLLSHKGILKVGDFGLAREYGSPLKQYTPIVVTLWYRAPELLLGGKEYSCPIDVWSVGCIFGELLKMEPMFPGKSEANQLNLIFQSLGTPNDRIWPGYSQMPLLQKITFADYPVNKLKTRFGHLTEQGIDLMNCFLKFNPAKRITAEDALSHPFFKEAPLAINPSMFPTWPAKSEMGHRKAPASPKPPSGGQQFKGLKEDEDSQGFFLGGNDARRHNLGGGFSLKF